MINNEWIERLEAQSRTDGAWEKEVDEILPAFVTFLERLQPFQTSSNRAYNQAWITRINRLIAYRKSLYAQPVSN